MTKITEFPTGTSVLPGDVFLFDGVNGTKKIAADILPFVLFESIPTMHKQLFRGKDLGSTLTATQKTNIANGSFTDLWLGDYWTIGGVKWRIADFNYWLGHGDVAMVANHLVVVPDTSLYLAMMNSTDVATGGYQGSQMRVTNLNTAKTTINSAFGVNVLSHRVMLINDITSGSPSGNAWYDSTVELMSEAMCFGGNQMTVASTGTSFAGQYTTDYAQLALFRVRKDLLPVPNGFWLRDVASGSSWCLVATGGSNDASAANINRGVRPVFAIG